MVEAQNMVAAQNMIQTLLGTVNSTRKGKKVEGTIHHTKQPHLSVRVSMIESLNEEIEIYLSSLSVCCSSFQYYYHTKPQITSKSRSIIAKPLVEQFVV